MILSLCVALLYIIKSYSNQTFYNNKKNTLYGVIHSLLYLGKCVNCILSKLSVPTK